MSLFRIDFQGSVYSLESFQHGYHVNSPNTAAEVAADAAAAWTTLINISAVASSYSTGIQWATVNVSELGATPANPITTSAQAAIADGGTGTTASLPAQCAPCLSFTTATAGSRARGRMYLPPPLSGVLTTSGRLSSTFRTDLVTGLDAFFASMEGGGHDTVVVSAVGGVWTPYPVNTIRLGDVVDTQRRRRGSIAEVYTTATI